MKALILGIIVLGTVALAVPGNAAEYRTRPVICVVLRDKEDRSSPGKTSLTLLPRDGEFQGVGGERGATTIIACCGVAGAKGPNGAMYEDHSTESSWDVSYTVNVVRPGHFILDVDYDLQKYGTPAKRIKRRFIVGDHAPTQSNWVKLDDRFATFAYLTPTATR